MVIIFCFIFAGLLMAFVIELGCNNFKSAKVLGALAVGVMIGLLGNAWYNNTSRVYQMHDVTVRVYYMDGSQKIIRLECISEELPFIDSRSTKPYLVTGRGSIPYIDRFDILEERCYEMTGDELRNKNKK